MNEAPFSVAQYKEALTSLLLTPKQKELLIAHYEMPGHVGTATKLANAVGWETYATVNAQYGKLARKVLNYLGGKLDTHTVTFTLADGWWDRGTDGQWHWKMWPQLAEGLESLGWVERWEIALAPLPDSPTEREAVIKQRTAQSVYRLELVNYWKGKCAVTRSSATDLLIASHIKPWRDCNEAERRDRFNGLLLTPNLDRAFDKGYISFADTGKILIKPEQEEKLLELGIHNGLRLRKIDKKHHPYLLQHRITNGFWE